MEQNPHYDYGTHFLFQGHELGAGGKGYITRINLDADGAHRVTLLATTDINGQSLPTIDGSTWYPFSHKLLFTSESGSNASVVQATPDFPVHRRRYLRHPRSGRFTKGFSLTELAG